MNEIKFPRWDELPPIDLYMDQVITYLNDKLSCVYFNNEKFITSSMINNYVKTSIVKPPVKKHYTKYHMAYFIAVTILKKCYSMSEISKLIQIHTSMKDSSVKQAYDLFISYFEGSLNQLFNDNQINNINTSLSSKQILMKHVVSCVVNKIYSEYVLSIN